MVNQVKLSPTQRRHPVDLPLLVKLRLKELGKDQRDLATAAQVTESYVSQLLTGKKAPPAPERTDIYDKIERFLRLPPGKIAKLADLQRTEVLKSTLTAPPAPLFKEVRALILSKCEPGKAPHIRALFEKEPFGTLERLVTQKLLDVVKRVAREELDSETWLRQVARLSGRRYAQMRVIVLEFLEADIFNVSVEHCVGFLHPLIDSWDIDLATFAMEIVLNHRLAPRHPKRFEFVEREPVPPSEVEPGLQAFLRDPSLSGDATAKEIEFLKTLRFTAKRPAPLYYYRELQSLRDPLHFPPASAQSQKGATNPRRRHASQSPGAPLAQVKPG